MKKYSLGLYEKAMPGTLDWKEKLEAAKEAGYDFVEISIDATEEKIARLDMTKEDRFEIIKAMYEVGMPIRTMCVSALTKYSLGNDKEEYCKRGMEILEKSLRLADDLGIRVVMIPGYDVYYEPSTEETRERFTENLRKTVGYAEKYGVLLGFETMETPFMNTCAKAMRYVSEINSPYLQIYPDVGNLTNALGDPLADLADAHGHITAAHLKETLPGQFRDVPFGTGHTPYVPAIRMLREMGVGMFVLEFWYVDGADPERYVQEARAYIAEKFREADVR